MKYEGFSLIEIVIAMSIFTMLVGSVAIFSIDSIAFIKNQKIAIESNNQANQLLDAVVDYKAVSWAEFTSHTSGDPKHFTVSGGIFSVADGVEVVKGVSRFFTVSEVYRDDDGNIVEVGGLLDPHSRLITVYAEWLDTWDQLQVRSVTAFVNNWEVQRWRNSTEEEFLLGAFFNTQTTNVEDGEVTLELVIDLLPNWCEPALSATYYDIPGQGVPRTVNAVENYALLGTGENASGDAFTKIFVTPVAYEEPEVTIAGNWNSGSTKVNHIHAVGNYAYISTDSPNDEVRILYHGAEPFTQLGSVNMPGSVNANVSFTLPDHSLGYIGQGRVFGVYDASNPNIDRRAPLDTLALGGTSTQIRAIHVIDNYAYVGVGSDANELYILDVSNPYDVFVVNSLSVNSMNTTRLYVNETETRLLLLTTASATEDELFLIDVTDKSSSLPIINSVNIEGMQTTTMAVVEDDNVFIIAGNSIQNQDNYKVYAFEDELNIIDCGGLRLDDDIYDISATRLVDPLFPTTYNYYTYAITSDSSAELQIVRGAEGEIGGQGYGYKREGTYTSEIYDTGATTPNYYYFRWKQDLPVGTTLNLQIRTGTSPADILTRGWVGPDGTPDTFFTDSDYSPIPDSLDGRRYIQFRAYMTTLNPDSTPSLSRIDIFFEQ